MARDPIDRSLVRLESRRFQTKCEAQVSAIRRADSMREISRLATLQLPYVLSEDYGARDAVRLVQLAAEDRARELLTDMINNFLRAEPVARDKFKRMIIDSWGNLTGPIGHLRNWAQSKLSAAEQSLK